MSTTPEERIKILVQKYLDNTLNPAERLELSDLAMRYPQAWETLEKMRSQGQASQPFRQEQEAAIRRGLAKAAASRKSDPFFLTNTWKWVMTGLAAAAVIALAFVLGPSIWKDKPVAVPSAAITPVPEKTDIEIIAGSNKAILTLTDGRTIRLDDSLPGGKLPGQGGVSAVLQDSGTIAYTADGADGKASAAVKAPAADKASAAIKAPAAFNTLTIPRGGQYRVILPDGTKVWLNNASSLHYPIAFNGNTRPVSLTGEAYFEVAKNAAKPFTVKVNDIDVHVLGTTFNINAGTAGMVQAVLLTGKVRVKRRDHSQLLAPGEALAINKENKWEVREDDHADEAIAWTRGYFDFRDMRLSEILKSLSLWYDVDLDQTGMTKDPSCELLGVSRKTPLSAILKILEDVGHFRIEGRKLIAIT